MGQSIAFTLPWPTRISADVERAARHNLEWVREHGLIEGSGSAARHYRSMLSATAGGAFYPDAEGADLDLMADMASWINFWDDGFEGPVGRDAEQARAVTQVLVELTHRPPGTPVVERNPLLRSWGDLWARLNEGMSAGYRARLARTWRDWLLSYVPEAEHRASGRVLDVADYLALRRSTIAAEIAVVVAERANRAELPADVLRDSEVGEARRDCVDVVALVNDLCSLAADEAHEEVNNIVFTIEHHRRRTRTEAVDDVLGMLDALVAHYLDREAGFLARHPAPGAERASRAMRDVMSANALWSQRTDRYDRDRGATLHGRYGSSTDHMQDLLRLVTAPTSAEA